MQRSAMMSAESLFDKEQREGTDDGHMAYSTPSPSMMWRSSRAAEIEEVAEVEDYEFCSPLLRDYSRMMTITTSMTLNDEDYDDDDDDDENRDNYNDNYEDDEDDQGVGMRGERSGRYGIALSDDTVQSSDTSECEDSDFDDDDDDVPDPLSSRLKVQPEHIGMPVLNELSPIAIRRSVRDAQRSQLDAGHPVMREQSIQERQLFYLERMRREEVQSQLERKRMEIAEQIKSEDRKLQAQYAQQLHLENMETQRLYKQMLEDRQKADAELKARFASQRKADDAHIKKVDDLARQREEKVRRQQEKERLKREQEEAERRRKQEIEEERKRKEKEEEMRKQREEEEERKKRQEEMEEEEKRRQEEAVAAATAAAADASKPKISVPGKGAPVLAYVESQRVIRHVQESRKFYKQHADQLKQYMTRIRKLINRNFNAVSTARRSVMEKIGVVKRVLDESKTNEALHLYCKDILAEKLVTKGSSQIANEKDKISSFAFGMIAVHLCNQNPDLLDFILACFYVSCPYTVPMYVQRKPGQSEMEYKKEMGFEEQDEEYGSYVQRMLGIVSLYAGIVQYDEGPNPHGVRHAWTWLARVLNMEPMAITVELLETFLSIAGYTLNRHYQQQYRKLLVYIKDIYLERVPKETPPSTIFRLRDLISTTLERGMVPEPLGRQLKDEAEEED